ncbi:50S ribosomal protein L23 [Spirochaeta cellobiosiphila]|uniref:50S ribosomal protein L23 n=1 Tax=Spirochaeta cellobiosiphila TaxID=504483 RepID=UPI00040E565E|nr:50S ribosomal protein L23 [Spirochaeta cellobiosiphila]
MRAEQVIIAPVLTEKTNSLREGEAKKYVFKVDPRANKVDVISAISEVFKVTVKCCNIINVKAKAKSVASKSGHRRGTGAGKSWKKAIVTIKAGDKIDIFEGA